MIVGVHPERFQDRVFWRPDALGICSSCRQTTMSNRETSMDEPGPPDRITVNKLLTPRRWDMVIVRYPRDPKAKYVRRLVGLPGESVYLKEGFVWVNDVKLEPPAELSNLRYGADPEFGFAKWGTPENPWLLQQDECCLLGDLSEASQDCREWGPVASSSMESVVTLTHWPPQRWRIWR
jgi:signal peptidase I